MRKILIIDENHERFIAFVKVFSSLDSIKIYKISDQNFLMLYNADEGDWDECNNAEDWLDVEKFDLLLLHSTDADGAPKVKVNKCILYGGDAGGKKGIDNTETEIIYRAINNAKNVLSREEAIHLLQYIDDVNEKPQFLFPDGHDPQKKAILNIIDELMAIPYGNFNKKTYQQEMKFLCAKKVLTYESCLMNADIYYQQVKRCQPEDINSENPDGIRKFYKAIAEVRDELFNKYCLK